MNIPEGWPTPEMIEAAKDARLTIPDETLPGKVCRIIFEAMIAAAPTPPAPEVCVTQEDVNNYSRILSLLKMEEEGDPVAEVERLLSAQSQPEAGPTAWAAHDTQDGFDFIAGWPELVNEHINEAIADGLCNLPYRIVPLYAHPQNDGLRKAASDALKVLTSTAANDYAFRRDTIKNLRNELLKK